MAYKLNQAQIDKLNEWSNTGAVDAAVVNAIFEKDQRGELTEEYIRSVLPTDKADELLKLGTVAIPKQIGSTLKITVAMRNPTSLSGTGYIRCSLVPSGQTVGIDLPQAGTTNLDARVDLGPNETWNEDFSIEIPAGTAPGMYDTVVIARSEANLAGTVYDEFVKKDSVEMVVVVAFTIEIVETIEA